MILGNKNINLYGDGYITDILGDYTFKISPLSFYQVNPVQAEALYNIGVEEAGISKEDTVFDLYCGIGTIGLIASKNVKELIGCEVNADAIKDAKINAKINNIENAKFICADAGEFMLKMKEAGEKADVVFMDPPRAGASLEFLRSLVTLAPEKVVYIGNCHDKPTPVSQNSHGFL